MPSKDVNLSFALNLPPEKVVEYFKQKGYQISFNWREVWQEAHHKAFTVAKAMDLDILKDIRNAVQKSIDEGITFEHFQKELEPVLKKKGWWGKSYMFDNEGNLTPVQLGSVDRLRTIYDTNITVAYAVGRYKGQIDNVEDRPYWRYMAVMDRNTRPAHAALNGLVFMYNDPFWDKYYPPNDWGCRCHVRALSEYDMEKKGLEVQNKPPDGFDPRKFAPEEWSYNPGKTQLWDKNGGLLPEVNNSIIADSKVDEKMQDISAKTVKIVSVETYQDYSRPDIRNVDDSLFLPQPEILPRGKDHVEALEILRNALGINAENRSIIIKSPIEDVLICDDYLAHLVEKRDNARERYANYIIPTLENPFEIYLTEYEDGYRRQYIGLFEGKNSFLTVVRINPDGSLLLWNVMQADKKKMNMNRVGELIYSK